MPASIPVPGKDGAPPTERQVWNRTPRQAELSIPLTGKGSSPEVPGGGGLRVVASIRPTGPKELLPMGTRAVAVFLVNRRPLEAGVDPDSVTIFQPPLRHIKHVEIETLMGIEQEGGDDVPEGADFFARRLTFASTGPLALVDRLVLLHRLREVMALVGFTRFESAMPDIDGELALNVRPASIARDLSWLPAVENRGEGFFISLRRQAVDAWNARPEVRARAGRLKAGFDIWQHRHGATGMVFPGAPFLLLHSLAHMLLTAVSLGCGYSASSIRERIYVGEGGYGILLYTGTSGTDGTLGGLVQAGRHLESFLTRALEMARLCSNDPVCAQHRPDNRQEERFLHGAACHGCLLIAEPSCERRNELLDRALVVETLDSPGTAFFAAE